jgi:chaperone modulatory protein CbpM
MITEHDVLAKIEGISVVQLRVWISEEWVKPAQSGATVIFNEADFARVQLLHLLSNELELGNEALPVILSLLDQVHDLNAQLRIICQAIEAQPEEIQNDILGHARHK